MNSQTDAATMIADELEKIATEETIIQFAADDSGADSLEQYEALVRTRLGGDYRSDAWGAAMDILRERHGDQPEAAETEQAFEKFVTELARADIRGCEAAGTEMDAEWTGEHTTALADYLGCTVAELDDSDIVAAKHLYRRAVEQAAD